MAGDYCEPWCVVWLDESGFGLRGCHDCFVKNEDVLERAVDCVNALEGIRDPAALVQAARDYDDMCRVMDRLEGGGNGLPRWFIEASTKASDALSRLRAALGEEIK